MAEHMAADGDGDGDEDTKGFKNDERAHRAEAWVRAMAAAKGEGEDAIAKNRASK